MPSTHDASALLAFAEPLLDGRRVLVVGDSSDALAERLVDMGARVVHVYDPSPDRALAAAPTTSIRNVSVRTLPDGDFEVRDGAFDVAIVPDLALVPEPEALVVRLRRVLGDAGVAMISAANGGPHQRFDYYQLFDLLALQWNDVRMVARVGFHGVAFAELGSEEIDEGVAVHTDLAGTPGEPEAWIAVASATAVELDRYSIVQLPDVPARPSPAAEQSHVAPLAEAVLRADMLGTQLEELREALAIERERSERLVSELDQERRLRERLASELSQSVQTAPADAERIAALEDGVRLAEQTIIALRERLGATEDALRESANEVIAARAELAAMGETRVDRTVLARVENELERVAAYQAVHEGELAALEEKLRERGEAIAELEAEVHRRERLVKELLTMAEEGPTLAANPTNDAEVIDLKKRLDALARTSAELRGELEAARWRIAELSRAPAQATAPVPAQGSAMTEIDALRQALAQEHAARVRAESGEELRSARAELERQAILLQQLQQRS